MTAWVPKKWWHELDTCKQKKFAVACDILDTVMRKTLMSVAGASCIKLTLGRGKSELALGRRWVGFVFFYLLCYAFFE